MPVVHRKHRLFVMMKILDDIWRKDEERDAGWNELETDRSLSRVKIVGFVAGSYAVDCFFLTLFSLAGTIHAYVPLTYGLIGACHALIFSLLHWTGYSARFKNPHLTIWQMCFAVGNQSIGMVLAPNITAFFLAITFIIFAFGSLRLSLRNVLTVWLTTSLTIAAVLLASRGQRLTPVNPSVFEVMVIWTSFSSILLRCQLLGYYAMKSRVNLLLKNMMLAQRVEHVQDMATHDALTNVYNRRAILPLIEEQIDLANRKNLPCAIAIIDIDHFKAINDTYGHLAGDEVLKGMVAAINAQIRTSDKLGRYGGEEFVLLMPATTLDDAYQVVDRMRIDICLKCWDCLEPDARVTFSAGLAAIEVDDDLVQLLTKTDTALYQAKNNGRNCVVMAEYEC